MDVRLDFGEIRYEVKAYAENTNELLWSFAYTEIRPYDFLNTKLSDIERTKLKDIVQIDGNIATGNYMIKFKPFTNTTSTVEDENVGNI